MWVLIMSITFGLGMDGKAAAIHSVDGFTTEAICEAAAIKARTMDRMQAICVRK